MGKRMKQHDSSDDRGDTPYTAYRSNTPLVVDGHLDEPAWQHAPKSPRFVDLVSGSPALYESRAAVVWDEAALYVGFWVEEPFIAARQIERDSLVFLDNDVEVFIDGGDTYYEFELNALGTIYEVFFIWRDAYTRGSRFDVPEFDVLARQALTFGGNYDRSGAHFWKGTHPRGLRWAFLDWDMPGLQTAVQRDVSFVIDGVQRSGWTAEVAFPWAGMAWLANGRPLPPQDGDVWRLFIGRYQQVELSGVSSTVGWAWDVIGSADNHVPERFTPIQFSTAGADER
jgi:hypothetical protein